MKYSPNGWATWLINAGTSGSISKTGYCTFRPPRLIFFSCEAPYSARQSRTRLFHLHNQWPFNHLRGDENVCVVRILRVGSSADQSPESHSPPPLQVVPRLHNRKGGNCPRHPRRHRRNLHTLQSATVRPAEHSHTRKLQSCGRKKRRFRRSQKRLVELAKEMIRTTRCVSH